MATVTAKLSDFRQAPRKVRLVANLVKGKPVALALVELEHRAKRFAPVMAKLINSAVANAKSAGLSVENLYVKEVRVDQGAILKRSRPRAHGRAFPIHKHTSHIMITLTDEGGKKAKTKDAKTEEAKKPVVAKKTAAKKTAKAK